MTIGNISVALILTMILIAINAMLASTEISLLGISEGKLQSMVNDGNKKAEHLLIMKQNPSRFLSTVQIGITLAGLLSGAFAADTLATPIVHLADRAGLDGFALSSVRTASTILITLLMTFFMLVFGELLPKRIAMVKPEETAFRVITPIHIFSKIVHPIVKLLSATVNALLRALGIDPNKEEEITEEDILYLLKEGYHQGRINAVELQVASNLFKFTDLKVKDAMTHRTQLKTVSLHTTLTDIITLISDTGLNKFPVIDGSIDHIIGIVYSKDVVPLYHTLQAGDSIPVVEDFMRLPYRVPKNKMLVELFTEMKQSKERLAVVVDDYGGTSGIITLIDILKQIVGDFNQPFNHYIKEISPHTFLVDTCIKTSELAHFLHLPELMNYEDTLNGFLINHLGYVPSTNDQLDLQFGAFSFHIEHTSNGYIDSIYVKRLPK